VLCGDDAITRTSTKQQLWVGTSINTGLSTGEIKQPDIVIESLS
jgi:hypothetical protein